MSTSCTVTVALTSPAETMLPPVTTLTPALVLNACSRAERMKRSGKMCASKKAARSASDLVSADKMAAEGGRSRVKSVQVEVSMSQRRSGRRELTARSLETSSAGHSLDDLAPTGNAEVGNSDAEILRHGLPSRVRGSAMDQLKLSGSWEGTHRHVGDNLRQAPVVGCVIRNFNVAGAVCRSAASQPRSGWRRTRGNAQGDETKVPLYGEAVPAPRSAPVGPSEVLRRNAMFSGQSPTGDFFHESRMMVSPSATSDVLSAPSKTVRAGWLVSRASTATNLETADKKRGTTR